MADAGTAMAQVRHRAYCRGYSAAQRHSWPEHRPPSPPEPVVAALMDSLRELRDAADSLCATLDPEDDFVKRLAPRIDAADRAMARVSRWLTDATVD